MQKKRLEKGKFYRCHKCGYSQWNCDSAASNVAATTVNKCDNPKEAPAVCPNCGKNHPSYYGGCSRAPKNLGKRKLNYTSTAAAETATTEVATATAATNTTASSKQAQRQAPRAKARGMGHDKDRHHHQKPPKEELRSLRFYLK